jgi:hypothetical protein
VSGWIPAPADGWEETAEILIASERRWPQQAVITDMRWMVDQGLTVPGRPSLVRRWRWEDWEVRKFLADEDLWRDPIRPREPVRRKGTRRKSTSSHQLSPAATSSHQPDNGPKPAIETVPPDPTSFHQNPPEPLHTRGDPPSPPPSPPPAGQTSVEPKPDRFTEAALFWGQVVHLATGRRPSQGPDRKSKLGQKLVRAVKADADLVLDGMRWVVESPDAAFHRGEVASSDGRFYRLDLEAFLRHHEKYATNYRDALPVEPPAPPPAEEPEESMLDEWERVGRPTYRRPVHDDTDDDSIGTAIRQRGVRRERRQPTA